MSEMAIDELAEDEWEQKKENMREEKIPFIVIKGQNAGRAMQASKIQDMMGEYYVWEMPRKRQDVNLMKKMNYIGGEAVIIGDTKIWTNSSVVKESLREDLARQQCRRTFAGQDQRDTDHLGKLVSAAMCKQVEDRELGEINWLDMEAKYRPGMLMLEQSGTIGELYYVDSFGNYWDEITNRRSDNDEVCEARLEELRQVHMHKVYEKVPVQRCWDETGNNPITARLLDINKGDEENKEYRSRLVAQEIKRDKREDLFAATPPLRLRKCYSAWP